MYRILFAGIAFALSGPATVAFSAECQKDRIDRVRFEALLQQVAKGWNANDARLAAAAFHEAAIYTEPPNRQVYRGRDRLFEFFGGPDGRPGWMKMTWHHISFNDTTQIGAGEFTYAWDGGQVHGMVSVKVRECLIANWREYFYESDLDWNRFQGVNKF